MLSETTYLREMLLRWDTAFLSDLGPEARQSAIDAMQRMVRRALPLALHLRATLAADPVAVAGARSVTFHLSETPEAGLRRHEDYLHLDLPFERAAFLDLPREDRIIGEAMAAFFTEGIARGGVVLEPLATPLARAVAAFRDEGHAFRWRAAEASLTSQGWDCAIDAELSPCRTLCTLRVRRSSGSGGLFEREVRRWSDGPNWHRGARYRAFHVEGWELVVDGGAEAGTGDRLRGEEIRVPLSDIRAALRDDAGDAPA